MTKIREVRTEHGVVRSLATDRASYSGEECFRRAESAIRAVDRWFWRAAATRTTWDEPEMNTYEADRLRRLLGELRESVARAERELDRVERVDRSLDRIRALRNVTGRTPEEAALYLKKAEELAT